MKILLFGATGMVGQGVLRECLRDPEVSSVVCIGRSKTGHLHEKLREILHKDLLDLSSIEDQFAGVDGCIFCLGISAVGLSEEAYRAVTYDVALAAAQTLLKRSPQSTFLYVSGTGTDSTEHGRVMWARVKGATENALLRMPFRGVYVFRPGYIQPLHGIRSKTKWYGVLYVIFGPLYPLWKLVIPNYVTTTEQLGCAMLKTAKHGAPKNLLESRDLREICPD